MSRFVFGNKILNVFDSSLVTENLKIFGMLNDVIGVKLHAQLSKMHLNAKHP